MGGKGITTHQLGEGNCTLWPRREKGLKGLQGGVVLTTGKGGGVIRRSSGMTRGEKGGGKRGKGSKHGNSKNRQKLG